MARKVLTAIGIGILAGAAIFFIPFPFRFFFFFFLIFFVIRFFWWRRWSYGGHYGYGIFNNPAYGRRWRSMSDEQRKAFIQKMEKELFAAEAPLSTEAKQ